MQEFKLVMEKASGELEEILVPEGTTFEEIAKSYQEDYKDLIVLACVDGKLRELNKEIKKDCSVKFLTSISRDGKRTYRRSMTLLMQKAIENLWGRTGACAAFCILSEKDITAGWKMVPMRRNLHRSRQRCFDWYMRIFQSENAV